MYTGRSALVQLVEGLRVDVRPYDLFTNALVLRLIMPKAYQIVYILADGAGCTAEHLGREEDRAANVTTSTEQCV